MGVSLEVDPSPAEPWDDCALADILNVALETPRARGTQLSCAMIPTHRNSEITHVVFSLTKVCSTIPEVPPLSY